jgi:beta-lactamase class A
LNTELLAPQFALGLLQAIRDLRFAATADAWQGGKHLGVHPSIDLAVVCFPFGRAPCFANVLFSREHPDGHVAQIAPDAGAVLGVRFDADQQDAAGNSAAWMPAADWTTMPFQRLAGDGRLRFVAPYPASLLKLMVAVGVALAVDAGDCAWPDSLEPMLVVSDNDATDACVAALHRAGWLTGAADNRLNQHFVRYGLATLQLNDTTPAGGWRNADGAGVGHIHMTAWDTARLLWLLDGDAPAAPWLPAGTPPLLKTPTRRRLRAVLARQQLDEVLSSGKLHEEPGWVQGLPDAPDFAHKTGTTDNYASDAGIVRTPPGLEQPPLHYIVAVLTSLGRRYAPTPACATTWRLPELGAQVHALVNELARSRPQH